MALPISTDRQAADAESRAVSCQGLRPVCTGTAHLIDPARLMLFRCMYRRHATDGCTGLNTVFSPALASIKLASSTMLAQDQCLNDDRASSRCTRTIEISLHSANDSLWLWTAEYAVIDHKCGLHIALYLLQDGIESLRSTCFCAALSSSSATSQTQHGST